AVRDEHCKLVDYRCGAASRTGNDQQRCANAKRTRGKCDRFLRKIHWQNVLAKRPFVLLPASGKPAGIVDDFGGSGIALCDHRDGMAVSRPAAPGLRLEVV